MSELRQDRTTGRWVIIAPDRGRRPHGASPKAETAGRRPDPEFDPECPFCPGNEAQLPGVLAEVGAEAPSHWATRVVPNKYPALQPNGRTAADSSHGDNKRDGFGYHEVIIESPRHNADLASMTEAEMVAAISAYRDRSRHLLTQPGIEAVVLFRNRGPRGGASLAHPHAQAIALGLVPPELAAWADCSDHYYRVHGRCAACDEIASEQVMGERVIEQTPGFLAYVPFAATRPGEIWIAPRQHQPSFADIGESELRVFARLLRRSLARLRQAYDDPAYNFVIDSADRARLDAPYLHWRLRIAPRLTTPGGFELGSGIAINPSYPEADAALLRDADRSVSGG